MTMANTLRSYLDARSVRYELIHHMHTGCSSETAAAAHVPGDQLAKGVMFGDELGYVMAVVPSTYHVEMRNLREHLHRRNLGLAPEKELEPLFHDCEPGALPPLGEAYGLNMVVDDTLAAFPDIYFEAGDHTDVVRISGSDFRRLTGNADHASFSRRIMP
jgi:Ala-tRNA(Pro) deacylase